VCTSHVLNTTVRLPAGAARLVLRQPCCRSSRIFFSSTICVCTSCCSCPSALLSGFSTCCSKPHLVSALSHHNPAGPSQQELEETCLVFGKYKSYFLSSLPARFHLVFYLRCFRLPIRDSVIVRTLPTACCLRTAALLFSASLAVCMPSTHWHSPENSILLSPPRCTIFTP
jgi:hypothetical protein